mmetsp:Transcript_66962/g.92669  ORF Transcript_66962/g.92669 Transcript_66962/m.92669 type:complete len:141 (+) Transcript_66962:311-733(+)
MTWKQLNEEVEKLARGVIKLDLFPQVEAEGKKWRFGGVWASNRWEWTATELAHMHYNVTTIGFVDAMSSQQVAYVLGLTELTTVFVSNSFFDKLVDVKKDKEFGEQTKFFKTIVLLDDLSSEKIQSAKDAGLEVLTFCEV